MHVLTDGWLRLEVSTDGAGVVVRLEDLRAGAVWADGPYVYAVVLESSGHGQAVRGLTGVRIRRNGTRLAVTGRLAGTALKVRHELSLEGPGRLKERIRLANDGPDTVAIADVSMGMVRRLDDTAAGRRLVAVPFRRQADGKLHDYSLSDLVEGRYSNSDWANDSTVADQTPVDRGKLRSEAWAWTDGQAGLLVAKYNDDAIEYSVAEVQRGDGPPVLRLGGAGLALYREPRAATRLLPRRSFPFGETLYCAFAGDWPVAYELYRSHLEQKGHAMPPDYSPPLTWNELFDVGWYHSDPELLRRHYTREALMKEAAKAREVGCDLLYLDPGWEVCEGTTLWDVERLGTVADFAKELREKYGLRLGYRTIGRVYRQEFPLEWHIRREGQTGAYAMPRMTNPARPEPVPLRTPDGRRNLALLPGVTASASSTIPGHERIHRVEHLNDGWYNNSASWISAEDPSWVELDLGAEHVISQIALGSEHTTHFGDRSLRRFRLLTAPDGKLSWKEVARSDGEVVHGTRLFTFEPVRARYVRLEIEEAGPLTARVDELEVYEAEPGEGPEPVRRPAPEPPEGAPIGFWEVCTQCRDWQREKLRRILAITGQGVDFMMFDEFDWRGPCYDPSHGHPVPSTPEGHVRAVYGLIEGVRKRYPHVLVEAHDPVWPWTARYLPTYFRQGFKPPRYQENWGFEFMWNPIEDLRSGRALCLYYYNLGCPVPLYDHITMEGDNDNCLSFWWYASTVRHLGIGGKKGLNSPAENEVRWQAYKRAVAEYNRLRPYYARGRFVGIEETVHVHVNPDGRSAVVNVYNLSETPETRRVAFPPSLLGARSAENIVCEGAPAEVQNGALVLTFQLPPMCPAHAVVRLR